LPAQTRIVRGPGPGGRPIIFPREPPIGRHAGWIFNNDNGQIVALFEDRDGIAHTVHVGDQVSGFKVLAITPEYLLMQDINKGRDIKLKLQGLDTYQGNKGTKGVQATPAGGPTPAVQLWPTQR